MTILLKQAQTMRLQLVFSHAQTPCTVLRSLMTPPSTFSRSYTTKLPPLITTTPINALLSRRNTSDSLRPTSQQHRHATTDATAPIVIGSTPTSTTLPSTSTSAPLSAEGALTWNEFFRLRKVRRNYSLVSSLGLSLTSLGVGMAILSQQNLNTLGQTLFGLDPMVVIGVWSLGFFGIGWLSGPAVGAGFWGLVHRSRTKTMAEKEKNFFTRIRKYRVDPSSSSVSNPVPDYYGEKITSVQGYRAWLKDQRAFNKKRQPMA